MVILSKKADFTTPIERSQVTLTVTMQSLLSHTRAHEENVYLRFIDMAILDIMEAVMSSYLLVANYRVTYIGHITAGKMMIKDNIVLILRRIPDKDAPAAKASWNYVP